MLDKKQIKKDIKLILVEYKLRKGLFIMGGLLLVLLIPGVLMLAILCALVFKRDFLFHFSSIFGSGLIMTLPMNVYMLFFNKTCQKSLSLYISSIVIIFIMGLIPWILIVFPSFRVV